MNSLSLKLQRNQEALLQLECLYLTRRGSSCTDLNPPSNRRTLSLQITAPWNVPLQLLVYKWQGPRVYHWSCLCQFQPQIFAELPFHLCLCSHWFTPQFFSLTPSTCHHDFLDEYYFATISCEACKHPFFLDCNGDLTVPPHIHASSCLLGDVWACG